MIRNNLRTRPRASLHTFRRHRGFILVEVMMSVVLVAIGTALAVVSATACNCNQTSPSASDYCEIDAQPFVLNESLSDGSDLIRWVAGDGSYAFDPIRGLLVLCSHDASTYIPGYDIC